MHTTIGPDFIKMLADAQLSSGLELDAAALRDNAAAWQRDRARIDALERDNARLQSLQTATTITLRDRIDALLDIVPRAQPGGQSDDKWPPCAPTPGAPQSRGNA